MKSWAASFFVTRRARNFFFVFVASFASLDISPTTSFHVFSFLEPSSSFKGPSAKSSIARAMAALVLGVYLFKSPTRSVKPNPGASCATAVAFSFSASGCSVARSHEYVFAPKPCTQETTMRVETSESESGTESL